MGVGLGNYPLRVKPTAVAREPIYVHNLYLDLAVEVGLVGLFSFLFFVGSCIPFKRIFSQEGDYYAQALFFSLIIFFVHSLFEYPLFSLHILPLFITLLALLYVEKNKHNILLGIFCLGFLLIPFADARVSTVLPLYILDIVYIITLIFALFAFQNEFAFFREKKMMSIFVLYGIILVGILLSYAINNPDPRGLGQIKSWFLLPITVSILVASLQEKDSLRDKKYLVFWLGGISLLLALLIPYYIFDVLTFDLRLQGPFTSPNFLAFFLFPGVILCQYFYTEVKIIYQKIFFVFLGATFLFALFLTHSFGGWLATFVAGISFARTFFNKKIFILLFFASAFIIGIFLRYEAVHDNKFNTLFKDRSSLTSRMTIWEVSGTIIKEKPFVGIGIGNFQEAYLSKQSSYPPFLEWAVPQPHNIFLAVWLQAGIVGLVASLLLLYRAFFLSSKISTKERSLLEALFVGILIYGIFDTPLFGNALAFVWWTVLALLVFPQRAEY